MTVLKNFNDPIAQATSLGKFMVDGAFMGKVTVTGSMDMFYSGWLSLGSNWWISADTSSGVGGSHHCRFQLL